MFKIGGGGKWPQSELIFKNDTFKTVFQTMFHNNKELLQGGVVRIQSAAKAESRFNESFDTQFSHV